MHILHMYVGLANETHLHQAGDPREHGHSGHGDNSPSVSGNLSRQWGHWGPGGRAGVWLHVQVVPLLSILQFVR